MKIRRVAEQVLPYQSKLMCFFFPCQLSKTWMNTLVILVNTTLVCHNFALISKVKFCVLQNMYLNMKTVFKLFMSENCLTLSQTSNFSLFQTERGYRRQFKIWWKWQKVLQMGRKQCGKRRNCSLRAISPFPTVFSKDLYCRHVKTRACLGKG